jgi:hypothetical protein
MRLGQSRTHDSKPFPLLDVETFAGHANTYFGFSLWPTPGREEDLHCIRILGHLEQRQDLLDVVQLFLLGYMLGLPQQGTESQRLADSGGVQVKVLLLNIACAGLQAWRGLRFVTDRSCGRSCCPGFGHRPSFRQ